MSWRETTATCRRATRIGEALLDGRPLGPSDRLHLATCAACGREAGRVARFLGRLEVAAETAMDEVPQPSANRTLDRLSRALVPAGMLTGAAAVGLLLAAVVGLRLTPPTDAQPALGSAEAAEERLAAMDLDLACVRAEGGTLCQSRAPDHVHRVQIGVRDGSVVSLEAGIVGSEGRAIDLRGADDLLRRMTIAALQGPPEAAVTAWLATTYPRCSDACSSDVAELRLTLEKRDDAVILTVEGR